eukprot:1141278-Pelagomonas_calceolata.AAC.3
MITKAHSESSWGAGLANTDIGSDDRSAQHNHHIPTHASRVIPPYRHAIQRLTTIVDTRHALHFQGTAGGGVVGCVAVESRRRRVQASRSMVDNPPGPN